MHFVLLTNVSGKETLEVSLIQKFAESCSAVCFLLTNVSGKEISEVYLIQKFAQS